METIVGKCPPEKEELNKQETRPFDATELYTEKTHFDDFETTLNNCRETSLDIAVVHTPHVQTHEISYIKSAEQLAEKLDAKLLLHSTHIPLNKASEIAETNLKIDDLVIENHTWATLEDIQDHIIDENKKLALDFAHLYRNNPELFQERLAQVFNDSHEYMGHLHLCDASSEQDHLQIGDDEMPISLIKEYIKTKYDKMLTLELMPDEQEEALSRYTNLS